MEGNLVQQLVHYYQMDFGYLWGLSVNYLLVSICGVLLAYLVGIPLDIIIIRFGKLLGVIITIANIIQTVPVITMLAILMFSMGLGMNIIIFTVFLYALLPITKNTYTGVSEVGPNTRGAGKGVGMTRSQVLAMIELPLSLSVIIGGIRIVLVVAIGVVAVGSFIGAPALDDIVIRDTSAIGGALFILAGAIPAVITVILVDVLLRLLEKELDPAT